MEFRQCTSICAVFTFLETYRISRCLLSSPGMALLNEYLTIPICGLFRRFELSSGRDHTSNHVTFSCPACVEAPTSKEVPHTSVRLMRN